MSELSDLFARIRNGRSLIDRFSRKEVIDAGDRIVLRAVRVYRWLPVAEGISGRFHRVLRR